MKRLRGCLVVALIFGLGFLAGGFFGAAFGWVGLFHKVAKGGPQAVQQVVLERAVHDLNLNPEQKVEARRIVRDTGAKLDHALIGVRPQVEQIVSDAEKQLRVILDEKQRRKLDRFVEQGRRRWQLLVQPTGPASTPVPAASTAE